MQHFYQNNFYCVANGLTVQRLHSILIKGLKAGKRTVQKFKEAKGNKKFNRTAHRHKAVLLADMTKFMVQFGCNIQPPESLKERSIALYHVLMYSIVFEKIDKKYREKVYPTSLNGNPMNSPVVFLYIGYLVTSQKVLMTGFDQSKFSPGWIIRLAKTGNRERHKDETVRCPDWSDIFRMYFHLPENNTSMIDNKLYQQQRRYWNKLNFNKGVSFVELATYIVYGVLDAKKARTPHWAPVDHHLFHFDLESLDESVGSKVDIESEEEDEEKEVDGSSAEEEGVGGQEAEVGIPLSGDFGEGDGFSGFVFHHLLVKGFFQEVFDVLPKDKYPTFKLNVPVSTSKERIDVETVNKKELDGTEIDIAKSWGKVRPKLNLFADVSKRTFSTAAVLKNVNQGVYLSNFQLNIEQSLTTKFQEILQLGKLLPMVCAMKNATLVNGTGSVPIDQASFDKSLVSYESLNKMMLERDNMVTNLPGVPSHDYHVLFMKLMQMLRDDHKEVIGKAVEVCKPGEEEEELFDVKRCVSSLLLQPQEVSVSEFDHYFQLQKGINPTAKRKKGETPRFHGRDPFKDLSEIVKIERPMEQEDTRREEMKRLFSHSGFSGE